MDPHGYLFNPDEMAKKFSDAGIDVDFKTAGFEDSILKVIQEWKDRGLKLDLVTCDMDATRNNWGVRLFKKSMKRVADEIGLDMLPEKVFFHSAADWFSGPVETPYGTSPCVLDETELKLLRLKQGPHKSGNSRTNTLRNYLNAEWGTSFSVSNTDLYNLKNPDAQLDLHGASHLLQQGSITPENALKRLETHESDLFTGENLAYNKDANELVRGVQFSSQAVPGAVTGLLAFAAEDVTNLKKNNPHQFMILALDNAAGYEIPPGGIDGLIIMNDGIQAQHITRVCENMGIPALVGTAHDGAHKSSFSREEGLTFGQPGQWESTLKAGDEVTMISHRNGGMLYAGKLLGSNYKNSAIDSCRNMFILADTLLEKSGVHIKGNVDTAEQAARAIEEGAHGIGLARTEHMFFQPEKKAMLREYLLSSEPSKGLMVSFREAQEADFRAILETANNVNRPFPVTVRLLDAPPGEFMPWDDVRLFEARVGKDNTRGAQTGLRTKGLYEAQICALCDAFKATQFRHPLGLLVPNILSESEMEEVREIFDRHANGTGILLSPMIEMKPYLEALAASPGISYASASYGTNDLTSQFMDGVAQNDFPKLMKWMQDHNIQTGNPFHSLMKPVRDGIMSVQNRKDAPHATICGQQVAHDEASIQWAARNGLSMSVPGRYIRYVKLAAAKELLSKPEPD